MFATIEQINEQSDDKPDATSNPSMDGQLKN